MISFDVSLKEYSNSFDAGRCGDTSRRDRKLLLHKDEILKIKKDFHSFTSLPTNEFEKEITGALLSGSKMLIPWGYRGQINLTYKAAAPEVSIDKADEEIPVPKETEHLIALLSAAYYWVDDSPDKAEYYLSLYKDALRFLKQCNTRAVGGGYRNVTGWA